MPMDEHGAMSVPPREGMYEVPAIGDPFKEDNRWPDEKTKKAYWDAVIAAHQTARRALHVGSVAGLVQTPNLPRDIHAAVIGRQAKVQAREQTLAAQAQLVTIAQFHNISVLHAPDGGLIVGAYDVFGSEDERTRFEALMQRANARKS